MRFGLSKSILLCTLLVFTKGAFAQESSGSGFVFQSANLETQLVATKAVESLLDKDPMILEEFIQNQIKSPVQTPIVLAIFNGFSKPAVNFTRRALVAKYGEDALSAGSELSHIPGAAGLAVGSLGTQLLLEWISGDLHLYWEHDKAGAIHRAKLEENLFGLGAGFGTSSIVSSVGGGVLLGLGVSNPVGWVVLGTASGVTFFLTSDYYEKMADKQALYGIEKSNLEKIVNDVPKKLSIASHDAECANDGARDSFDGNLLLLGQAFASTRAAVIPEALQSELDYLNESIDFQTKLYQQVHLAEWVGRGADPGDADYRENAFDWIHQYLPYNQSIEISLAPDQRGSVTEQYIANLKSYALDHQVKANQAQLRRREAFYDKLLQDEKFSEVYREHLETILNLIAPFSESQSRPLLTRARELLNDRKNLISHANELMQIFKAEAENFALHQKAEMGKCYSRHLESLYSNAVLVSSELNSFASRTYFAEVVDQSIQDLQKVRNSLR